MISVIVCSANKILLDKLRINLAGTIGVPYELLVVENYTGQRSIASIYNEAGSKAKFDILCFVHEDVIIHDIGWGQELIKLFENSGIGLVGISGAVYKSAYPGTWSTCHPKLYRTNSLQHFPGRELPLATDTNQGKLKAEQVAVIDGVFMATTKKVFEQYRFDEQLLKGFHGYDIDYALQVNQEYKVVVSYRILLEHLSAGILSQDWLADSIAVHKKWKDLLPVKSIEIEPAMTTESDYRACSSVLQVALKDSVNKGLIIQYYLTVLFRFYSLNKLKYTKSVWRLLISGT